MNTIEIKKPWYIPSILWNMAIDKAADVVKGHMKPDNLATIFSRNEAQLLRLAVKDRDPNAIARVTRVAKQVAQHSKVVLEALEDGIITTEEEIALADDIRETAQSYITEAEIFAEIDRMAEKMKV